MRSPRTLAALALTGALLAGGAPTPATASSSGTTAAARVAAAKKLTPAQKRAAARRLALRRKLAAKRLAARKALAARKLAGVKKSVGPRGPRGPKGPKGATGPTGATGAPGQPAPTPAPAADPQLRVLAINDFHGNLQPPTGSSGSTPTGPGVTTPTGGAAYLGTRIRQLEADAPGSSVLVGAGDLIGASPLISGLFHDEPTIEAMNAMGMDYAGVGNHEFDEGSQELLRMQFGGCHPQDGCQDGDPFYGADFSYLAANVRYAGTDQTLLPPYRIRRVGGIPVAFIGVTLKDTPTIVTPSGVAGLAFDDEAAAVNRVVRTLADGEGVQAFVVLIHQGGQQNPPYAGGFQDVNRCDNLTGDIIGVVNRLDSRVDAVLSAHTHQPYVCNVNNKLLTSASSFGRLVTKVDLTLDRATGDVKRYDAANVLNTRDVAQDPAVKAIVDKYAALAAPIAQRVVGTITATIDRAASVAGEQPLGDVIADSQLAATSNPSTGNSVVAFMNPGGIRADLAYGADGKVTYEAAYTVQPFANTLVVKTLTGAQIKALLEQQFDNPSPGATRFLQVSDGFTYTWSASAPAGSHVDPASIRIGGVPVDPAGSYRVTMNNFLATGGDGFTVFAQGTNQLGGDVDIDAFTAYLGTHPNLAPPAATRITRVP